MKLADMERHATLLDRPSIYDDIRALARSSAAEWKPRMRRLSQRQEMTAAMTPFRTLLGPEPPIVNQTTVTGVTVITLLWDTPNLTPIPASNVAGSPLVANTVYTITAWGVVSVAVTGAQTATLTPIFGTTTGGTSLGASIAAPIGATALTNTPWIAQMWVHFRSVGASGTATCIGGVEALPFVGVAAGTAQGATVPFGTNATTATTVNTTAVSGLSLAITPSLATQSWTCLGVVGESLN